MSWTTAKITAQNQLTIPKRMMERLGWPTHVRMVLLEGERQLLLRPARLVSYEQQATDAGIPKDVLTRAYALIAEAKQARAAAQEAAADGPAAPADTPAPV
jgi:bifunctional DNA-binding transcriptional regulator/antitoxin component of YhaV-PrlF toxin-antitoxin module